MVIFLLFLGERGTIGETERHKMVGKLKNLGNVKRSESGDKDRDGRKDRSGKERDIRALPPCVQSLR